jgi:hypothetical protein
VRIQARDRGGLGLSFQRVLATNVTNANEAPTAILIGNSSIDENTGANAKVGIFSTLDTGRKGLYCRIRRTQKKGI